MTSALDIEDPIMCCVTEDLLDFDLFGDFFDFESDFSDPHRNVSSIELNQNDANRKRNKTSLNPHKSRVTQATKIRRSLGLSGGKPNISRRRVSNALYTFPSYDKCDSLLFMPSTFIAHINCGDMEAALKLISARFVPDCEIRMHIFSSRSLKLNVQSLIKMHQILNDTQPDRFMCVHSTKVDGNKIRVSVYMKGTDCKVVHDSVVQSVTDPLLRPLINMGHQDMIKMKIDSCQCTDEQHASMYRLMEAEVDLVVYVSLEMVFTFDDHSRKVTDLDVSGRVTSIKPAPMI